MGTSQLLDALTDHLALYHREISRAQTPDSKGAVRNKVLEWMAVLSAEQRQTTMTISDRNWVAIVLQMHKRLKKEGAGYFFLLTDVLEADPVDIAKNEVSKSCAHSLSEQELELKKVRKSHKSRKRVKAQPSSTSGNKSYQDSATGLPGLCFRKAKGLLARLDEQQAAGELLSQNLEFFTSEDTTAAEGLNYLDTVSVSVDLLKNLDQFLAIMDTITHGEFLTTVAGRSSSPWEELPWLKAMGYYSLPAFVANKLELAVWSAWFQAEGSRRPSRNLAREFRKTGRSVQTGPNDVSASLVCRRNKGFTDWWAKLPKDVQSRALRYAVARAAKVEVLEAVKASRSPVNRRKASKAQGIITEETYLSETDFEQWCPRSIQKEGVFGSLMAGLDAIRKLTSSSLAPLLLAMSEGADVTQATEFFWLPHSSLDSADTLQGHVTRSVGNALKKVMVKSMELDLLKNESCASHPASSRSTDTEGKAKRDNRRKKIQKSVHSKVQRQLGDEAVQTSSGLSQEQLGNHHMRASTVGNKHETPEKHYDHEQVEERSLNRTPIDKKQAKKKKHGRAKLKAVKESSHSITVNEGIENPSCKLEGGQKLETRDCSDGLAYAKSVLDLSHADCSSQGLLLSGNQTAFCAEHCPNVLTVATHPQHLELTANEVSTVKAAFLSSTDSHCIADNIHKNVFKSLDNHSSEEGMQIEILDERSTQTEISLDSPPKTAAMSSSTETNCKEFVSAVSVKESMEEGGISLAGGNTHTMVPDMGREVSSEVNNVSTPKLFPRSLCSSPMICDSYSHLEGLKRERVQTAQTPTFVLSTAHEWPGITQVRLPRGRSQIMPPATERLHLDVSRNWQQRLQASRMPLRSSILMQQSSSGSNPKRSNSVQNGYMNLDCSPIFPTGYNLAQNRGFSFGYIEEPGFIPLSQTSFPSAFTGPDFNVLSRAQDESKHDDRTPEDTDYDDSNYFSGDFDDHEGYLISEEEGERQFLDLNLRSEGDYNQIFGGGVMYWNTADYGGMGYSRPPSLSSEDSSWARHEANLSIMVDDFVGLSPMSGTFANVASPNLVSTSPPTAAYDPGFEHNTINAIPRAGLPVSGNENSGNFSPLIPTGLSAKSEDDQAKGPIVVGTIGALDGPASDIATRPVLRPIIVVRDSSRQGSVSESVRRQDARSPHVPRRSREMPRQRRPPSPILRCVPPAPPPPPPSPVGGFGKRKGLTTVRSGSSSPRRWGLTNCSNKEDLDGPFFISEAPEAVANSWRSRNITSTSPMHPFSRALLRERLIAIPPLAVGQDHPDVALPMQTSLLYNSNPSLQSSITRLHSILHEEIEGFCKQVAAENLLRKPFISTAVNKVARALQVLWPRSRIKIFGSAATGLALPCSDVDVVVCLPPVRNLEPIKEAGILEGRNGIKETCLQHAARYLADQDWVKSDTLKTIENTAIPIIMLVANVPSQPSNITEGVEIEDRLKPPLKEANMMQNEVSIDANGKSTTEIGEYSGVIPSSKEILSEEKTGPWGGKADRAFVRLDISFEAPSHTGLRTAALVRELTAQFPAIVPLALVLKQFLTDRSLDHPYTGGLSSYCLVLLITRFLQHQHHLGWPFQQNLGSLLMDFLHFFGCVFDPRRMGISIRGGGIYVSRDRGHSIDPLHIEDPLHPSNNVGRNCFRILQCVKAFADAYSYVEKALVEIVETSQNSRKEKYFRILPNILPSVASLQ